MCSYPEDDAPGANERDLGATGRGPSFRASSCFPCRRAVFFLLFLCLFVQFSFASNFLFCVIILV